MTVQDGLDIQVPQPALLFDLDGTLVDSVYQHVIAWQEALATCGIELSVWRIHRRIGMSGGLFIDALSRETGVRLDEELSQRLRELHAQAYLRRHETVVPLPGARELLAHLHERQVPFAIATSGARHTAGSALALLGLPDDVPVVTRDLVERAKPDPHLFLAAARRLGVDPAHCFVVGDSVWDLLAAQRAGALAGLPKIMSTRAAEFGVDLRERRVGRLGSCYYTTPVIRRVVQRLSGRVKSKNRGGSGRSRARGWSAGRGWWRSVGRRWPSVVARVTRCIRSSSWRRLRQVSPVAFSIDADEQQRQPAQLDVGADAVLAVVEHRAQPERALAVAPAAFDGEQLLVGGGEVVGGEGEVGGAQQPLAVQVGLAFDGGLVDAQQPGLGAAQVAAQPRLGLEASRRARRGAARSRRRSRRSAAAGARRGWSRTAASRSACSGLWQITNRWVRAPSSPSPSPPGATATSLTRRLSATVR